MSDFISGQDNSVEMKPVLSEAGGDVFQPLVNMAVPDLYQKNAFRILGLPTNSDPREIRRQIEKTKLMSKYGSSSEANGPLTVGFLADADVLQEISHELKDPEYRILQELFWFWPDSSEKNENDPAITALTNGDVSAAADIWSLAPPTGLNGKDVRRHNLAILYHTMALDYEALAASGVKSEGTTTDCEHVWNKAFKYWKSILDSEGLWSEISKRVQEVDDQRLTIGTARHIRATLPAALLSINAKLAVQAANSGRSEDCARLIRVMRHLELGQEAIAKAKRSATQPIIKRLNAICKKAVADAEADRENADKASLWLIEHAEPLLAVLNLVIGEGQLTRDNAYDKVALAGLGCVVDYGNETEDWPKAVELLEKIAPLPAGASARSRINQNLEAVRSNASGSICWFCENNASVDKYSFKINMYGNVRKIREIDGIRTTWNHGTINVGRCASCAEVHVHIRNKTSLVGAGLGLVACSVGIIIWNVATWAGLSLDALSGGLVWAGIGSLVGAILGAWTSPYNMPGDVKPLSKKLEHPRIKKLLEEGWAYGEKPDTEG